MNTSHPNRRDVTLGLMAAGALPRTLTGASAARAQTAAVSGGRERLLLDTGWRFIQGDPADARGLDYDVRPKVGDNGDGKAADTPPEAAAAVSDAGAAILKPWILPSANAFIKDPAKHHARPAGEPVSAIYAQLGFDDSGWESITLPHDWAIRGPFLQDGPYGGMGRLKTWGAVWYRRALDIGAADQGRSVFLDIDGAMSYASIWLNGRLIGGWPYGYASWRLDLTPHLNFGGVNLLAIRLDNPPDSARWYPGAGLYRHVWLTKTHGVHVGQWGTFVRTPRVTAQVARIELDVTLDNDGGDAVSAEVLTRLFLADDQGRPVGQPVAAFAPQTAQVPPRGSVTVTGALDLAQPRLWGPPPHQMPNRYCAVSEVRLAGRRVDSYETVFGVRDVVYDPDAGGLIVNGETVPLKGVNNHHDLGALGAAFHVRAAARQLEILREMGCNALRMSHNPPAPELLDLADRMGFLVIDEVFDCWYRKKTPLDFHLIFADWHEADLRAMIRRDRNHASIVIWSVGNEVGEQYTGEDGAAVGRELGAIARDEDPTRPTMTAMNYAKADMPLPAVVDIVSLNYQGAGIRTLPGQFPAFRKAFPNKVILSSESASAFSSRGEYQFPVPGVISASVRPGAGGDPATQQVSAYELFAADFGSSPDRAWAAQDQSPYVAGEFVWSGFDYLGEPTPYYGARSSYCGMIDLAGFAKDRFWLYQSRWRPDLPMAHLLPHWTWPGREGQVTPVHLFTSGDEAELFVNGKSQGRQKKAPFAYRLRWDYVTYEPGEISVIVYKDGKAWARDSRKTAGAPAKLDIEVDRAAIMADGKDLAFVTVQVRDSDGNSVPRANHKVRFSLEGDGEIIATDNGDPTDMTAFPSPDRRAFNGLVLAIVRFNPGGRGDLRVSAQAEGLTAAQARITAA